MTDTDSHPTLIIIRGIPGSGKSHLAAALSRTIDGGAIVLDPDAVDQQSKAYLDHVTTLRAEGVDEKLHLYRFSRAKAYEAIKAKKTILWNQAFNDFTSFQKMIDRLQEYAAEVKTHLAILVVEVEIDQETARQRITARAQAGGHDVDDDTLTRFIDKYESFSGKGYSVVTVSGRSDIADSVQAVTDALAQL
jgi:predicted ABC-type ATPase